MHKINENTPNSNQNLTKSDETTSASTQKVERVKKAKEAEDLHKSERITRRNSFSQLNTAQRTEKEEIAAKSGEVWTCVSRKPNKLGGYIYSFSRRIMSTDEMFQHDEKLYPAVEINDPILSETQKELGYSYKVENGRIHLELLDREALMANWKNLQQSNPHLSDLNVANDEGIADDITFVEAYFTHDVLLSSGREFVHDSLFHVLPMLDEKISYGRGISWLSTYKKVRFVLAQSILKLYQQAVMAKRLIEENKTDFDIDLLNKVNLALGYTSDVLSATSANRATEIYIQCIGRMLWDSPSSHERAFLQRKFGTSKMHEESFEKVQEKLKSIEEQFKNLRKKD
ncbi:MAG: hypothetical protein JSR58_05455 [Verrucomicrobia bacterium]|nr:hypothetical protein [Verrucomicrobiota bacterium]